MTALPGKITAADGLDLACYSIQSNDPSDCPHLFLVHGMGDHFRGLPYRLFCEFFAERGFTLHGMDLRGHGASGGKRMFAPSWPVIREDFRLGVDRVRDGSQGPFFLVGLSMGGLIALDLTLHYPERIDGVVAVAPALSSDGASPFLKLLLKTAAVVIPRALMPTGLDLSRISRDEEACAEYTRDPFFQTKVSAKLAAEVLSAIEEVSRRVADLRVPTLLLHGLADEIVPPRGTVDFFAALQCEKRLITYDGAMHNLFIETNREDVFADIYDWLTSRSV